MNKASAFMLGFCACLVVLGVICLYAHDLIDVWVIVTIKNIPLDNSTVPLDNVTISNATLVNLL